MAHSSISDNAGLVIDNSVNEVPEALQVPTKAVSPGFQLLLSLANTAIWLSILPIGQILLPLQIAAFNTATIFSNLAIATSVGVLAALLTNPIAGALSDRTTSRLGRRRPWLIVGTVFSAMALALMANASNFIALVIWWAIFHVAANAILAALSAVIPRPGTCAPARYRVGIRQPLIAIRRSDWRTARYEGRQINSLILLHLRRHPGHRDAHLRAAAA